MYLLFCPLLQHSLPRPKLLENFQMLFSWRLLPDTSLKSEKRKPENSISHKLVFVKPYSNSLSATTKILRGKHHVQTKEAPSRKGKGQIKKIHVFKFRVTQPYLNLLVKPNFFSRFSGKNIILCILKGEFAFQNA